jgi:hypothetical protein
MIQDPYYDDPNALTPPAGVPSFTPTSPAPTPAWDPTQYLPTGPQVNTNPFAGATGYGAIPWTGDPQAYVKAIIQQFGLKGAQANPAALQTIIHGLQGRGVNVALDSRTDGLHKGIMLNGQFVKLLDGNDNWIWQTGADAPGGGGSADGSLLRSIDPSYLAPFTEPLPDRGTLPAWDPSGVQGLPQFQSPGEFHAPTGQSILDDPGYQFRRDQAMQSTINSKAAQGLFNSGGSIYDLGNLVSNFAGQEYNNAWNRDFGLWNQNWQNALAKYGADLNTADASFNRYNTGFGNQMTGSNELFNRSLNLYQNARDTFYANQQNPFQKLMTVAQLGANTAANAG